MSIFDVRHQPRAHRILQRALVAERLPHAYIFHGPDGVGKEALAVELAGVLLCAEPKRFDGGSVRELGDWSGPVRDRCGRCDDCRVVSPGTHPDLHLIYRRLNRAHPDKTVRDRKAIDLGVDVIRHFVIDAVGLKPGRGRAKVFILREADMMSPAAQNALLKTLEEPPAATFLILLVSLLDRLLPTTLSRCQQVPFMPLPLGFLVEQLRRRQPGLTERQADFVARLSLGSLGAALQYADDRLFERNERILAKLANLPHAGALAVAKELLDEARTLGEPFRKRNSDLSETETLRQGLLTLLAILANFYGGFLRGDRNDGDAGGAGSITPEAGAEAISAIGTAERQIDRNASPPLCLESLVFHLARLR